MSTIAVTGAAGLVGRRTVPLLARTPAVTKVVAIDQSPAVRRFQSRSGDGGAEVVAHRVDVRDGSLAGLFDGVDTVVHLAEDPGRRGDPQAAGDLLSVVTEALTEAGVGSLVVLSSATVYGARPDNPIPITEAEPRRPNDDLGFAMAKAHLEDVAGRWAEEAGRRLVVLRPTTTLSEHGASWVAAAIRAAAAVRADQTDPPVQFLHHDDLAAALVLVSTRDDLAGVYNVAPDGWIGPEAFRQLVGGPQMRVPGVVKDQLLVAGRRLGVGVTPPGIEPYVRNSWVLANGRLRRAGWVPFYTNEETHVISTPPPLWALSAQRRQEVALGVLGAGLAAAAGMAGLAAKRMKS